MTSLLFQHEEEMCFECEYPVTFNGSRGIKSCKVLHYDFIEALSKRLTFSPCLILEAICDVYKRCLAKFSDDPFAKP